jgi:hypothetical protein
MTARQSQSPSSASAYQPYRLELIQETPQTLTFKQGSLSRRQAVKKAWVDLLEALIFFLLPVSAFFSPVPLYVREHWGLKLPSAPAAYHWIGLAVLVIPIVYTALIKPCFVVWTFDRTRKHIIRAVTNGVGMELQTFFEFREILAVDVYQRYTPGGRENSYCWLILDSGHKVFFSACKTGVDRRSKALIRKHHLQIAERMREVMQIYTPPAARADRLVVPPASQQDPQASFKEIYTTLFQGKKQRQERIEFMRRQVIEDPQNGQAWEDLAFALSLSVDDSLRQEVIEAYRQAETLYRSTGNLTKAEFVASVLRKIAPDR